MIQRSVFFSGVQFRTLDDKLWNSLDARVRTWKTSVPCLRSEEFPNRKMSRWTDARDLWFFQSTATTYVMYIYLCIYAHLYTLRLTYMSYVYIYIDTIKLCKALVPFPFFWVRLPVGEDRIPIISMPSTFNHWHWLGRDEPVDFYPWPVWSRLTFMDLMLRKGL